jgi:2-oxoglutarate/2-oxoacid ferredoxin oxidoreductase subunit alpha
MPEVAQAPRTRKFRGRVYINLDRCKGCGFCIEFCPPKVLKFSDKFNNHGYHPPFLENEAACTGCDLCGLYCPDFAIFGMREAISPEKAADSPLGETDSGAAVQGGSTKLEVGSAPASALTATSGDLQPGVRDGNRITANPVAVLTGPHFLDGDQAACEGAVAAGANFAAGYPITPSTEVVERFASRAPLVGATFLQMEDELASSIAILGAAWGGAKVFTVTSGPGFSLMMEHIGLAAMTETPCVYVNVQRGGPSTGLPTLPGQGDMMQARWGSHGDYEIIALSPNSPQECFDLMIEAFNLSEEYRTPVLFMMDESVGHMTEKVVIPAADQIKIFPRRFTAKSPHEYLPFEANGDGVPEMARAGDGYHIHVTGLTHNERGYPALNWRSQQKLVSRLVGKIRDNADRIAHCEEHMLEDAEVVLVAYGITSRVALEAVQMARRAGIRAGLLRPVVVWPFPEKRIRELALGAKAFVVVEMNLGQMVNEVERCAGGTKTVLIPHAGGNVHAPDEILKVIEEVAK